MPKHRKPFSFPLLHGPDQEQEEQDLKPNAEKPMLRLSDYTINPIQSCFDDPTSPTPSLPPIPPEEDVPQGYDLFVKTMQAMEERYPFWVGVLQFQALTRVLQLACEEERLHTLDEEDYTLMLTLMQDLDILSMGCAHCNLEPEERGNK